MWPFYFERYGLRESHARLERSNAELAFEVEARTHELARTNALIGESERRYRDLFEFAAEGIFVIDVEGQILNANRAACKMLGYKYEDLVQKPIRLILASEEIPRMEWSLNYLLPAGTTQVSEWRLIKQNGEILPVEVNAQSSGEGKYVLFTRDITERKQVDRALQLSEQQYRDLFESAYDAIAVSDSRGCMLMINNQLQEMFGYLPNELHGRHLDLLLPTNIVEQAQAVGQQIGQDRILHNGRNLFGRRKDGSVFPVDVSISLTKSPEGRRITVVIRDITERRKIERQNAFLLKTSEILTDSFSFTETLRKVAELCVPEIGDLCSVSVFEDGQLHYRIAAHRDPARQQEMQEFGEKFVSRPDMPFNPAVMIENKQPFVMEDCASILHSPDANEQQKEGIRRFGLSAYIMVPMVARGKSIGAIFLGSAESKRKFYPEDVAFAQAVAARCALAMDNARLYEEALQAAKDREYLLSIVSHDLKNPLATIQMASHILANAPADAIVQSKNMAKRIETSTGVMQRLISDLLDFGKIQAGNLTVETRPENPNGIIDCALDDLRGRAEARKIRLDVFCEADLPNVRCDRNRVIQVLWNLVGNAIKFSPFDSRIRVLTFRKGDHVQFVVSDRGPGIPPENREKIFERFWQAKETAHAGSGLGLSIAKGIIESHGGRIGVESRDGGGSDFYFTLPTDPAQTDKVIDSYSSRPARPENRPSPLAGVHVLLVDDSAENRFVVKYLLERAGARVSEANGLMEAMEHVMRDRPNVMLTDIEMPGGDGFELIERVRQLTMGRGNEIPIAALTAHTQPAEVQRMSEAGFEMQLAKPVTYERLISSIESMLDGRHQLH